MNLYALLSCKSAFFNADVSTTAVACFAFVPATYAELDRLRTISGKRADPRDPILEIEPEEQCRR
jgi:hypothetical protein